MLSKDDREFCTGVHIAGSGIYQGWADAVLDQDMAGDYQLVAKSEVVGRELDFSVEEMLLALIMAKAVYDTADPILDTLFAGQTIDTFTNNIDVLSAQANNIAQQATTVSIGAAISRQISNAMNKGADKLDTRSLLTADVRRQVYDGMVNASKYYTNNYFNNIAMPEMYSEVEKMMDGGAGYTLDTVRTAMDKRLKSVPYWRTVGNAAASRAYHYGLLKGGSMSGYRSYMFLAKRDNRTTEMCQFMDGRTWQVEQALVLVEGAAKTENVKDSNAILPFVNKSDVPLLEELTDSQLADRGVLVPPLHFNCRSTIMLMY